MKAILRTCLALVFLIPAAALANLGVGVGTGKIVMDAPLRPGGVYVLAPVMVLNTGDQVSGYAVAVAYNEIQPELKPNASWFRFSPDRFDLAPGKARPVTTTLSLPVNAPPGKYFAYLEAHPVLPEQAGLSHVGIAAAAKLYFTIAPANIVQGMYYRILSILATYAPWTYVGLIILAVVVVFSILRRFVSLNISFRKRSSKP